MAMIFYTSRTRASTIVPVDLHIPDAVESKSPQGAMVQEKSVLWTVTSPGLSVSIALISLP
jgi:hypothetical protein